MSVFNVISADMLFENMLVTFCFKELKISPLSQLQARHTYKIFVMPDISF